VGRRDQPHRDKTSIPRDQFVAEVIQMLDEVQQSIYTRAKDFKKAHSHNISDKGEFYAFFTPRNTDKPEIHGGFVTAHWCGSEACEMKIKEALKVTIRSIPLDNPKEKGSCIDCGRPSHTAVVFAKAY